MKKALVVSFFGSNNLGDLSLSNTIEDLVSSKGYIVNKYDFLSVSTLKDNVVSTPIVSELRENNSFYRTALRVIKHNLFNMFGKDNIEVLRYHFNQRLFPRRWEVLENDIKKTDILVIGGGNMLMDINPIWPDIFKRYILLAKKHKKEIYVVYIGAGPINNKRSKRIYSEVLKYAKKISVRDPLSKKVCEEVINDQLIIETIDPVFSLPLNLYDYRLESLSQTTRDMKLKIGISVLGEICFGSKRAHDDYLDSLLKLAGSLSSISKNSIEFMLFSTETGDYSAVNEFKGMLTANNLNNINVVYLTKVDEVIDLYKKINFLIGGRMHGLIFAQKCLLPFIGCVWQDKVKGFGHITRSSDRLYEVNYIKENHSIIANEILLNILNNIAIIRMNEINKELNQIVQKGNID